MLHPIPDAKTWQSAFSMDFVKAVTLKVKSAAKLALAHKAGLRQKNQQYLKHSGQIICKKTRHTQKLQK